MSADKDEDYFSDGLAEEIINLLAQASGLKVIARSSAFAFRGKDEDVRKIAQALDVTHVLEGSVRRAGGRIRVTAQLISAADGGSVWSERYDREMRDVFALQDDIAEAIAKALRVRLSGEAPPRHVPALPAYEAYLRARHHQAKVTPEAWDLAKACFESAIELIRRSRWPMWGWVTTGSARFTSGVRRRTRPYPRPGRRPGARSASMPRSPRRMRCWGFSPPSTTWT